MKALVSACLVGSSIAAISAISTPDDKVLVVNTTLVNQLLEEARQTNPGIRASDSRAAAAKLNEQSVRTWEDPITSFGGSVYSPRGFSPAEEGDLAYGLEERLPLWGKPKLARVVAQSETLGREAETSLRIAELRRDIAQALLETALAETELRVAKDDLTLVETMLTVAESQYRTGTASLADHLQLENEVSKSRDAVRTQQNTVLDGRYKLNRLVNRGESVAVPSLKLPPVAPTIPLSEKLLLVALQGDPQLKLLDSAVKQTRASAAAVAKSRLPDVSLSIEGRQYSGDAGFRSGMFTLRVPIPWVNSDKYRADLLKQKQLESAASLEREEHILTLKEQLHHISVDLDASTRRANLYGQEISGRTSQVWELKLAEWQTGRARLSDVLEARRGLIATQLTAARATAEQHRIIATMVFWTGLDGLEALIPFSKEPPILRNTEHNDLHASP